MNPEVFIPIVLFLVLGAVVLAWIYYRSQERQLIIEKGLTAEQMKELMAKKWDPYILLKMGIIILFFGFGLGVGMFLEELNPSDLWVPFSLFTFTGVGFIVAYNASRKLKLADKKEQLETTSNSSPAE
ncbi:MAG: phage shock protein B [Chlorobi bacterium]|nr:phage shock protein B [Chlorobiota bacterium]